jgi:hypothetical protein
MLPVLSAVIFDNRITQHTRTQPWIVIARDNHDDVEPYVVKLFSYAENAERQTVAREVFANVIAGHFNLSVPQAAFVDFYANNFLHTLNKQELDIINARDPRMKFAVKYLPNHAQYNYEHPRSFYHKFTDIDSIFAFDNLILNTDRNIGKANVLLVDRRVFLIDHEYSLDVSPQIISEFDSETWSYRCIKHIFYDYLLDTYRPEFFTSFLERLSTLDPNILDPYEAQLRGLGYDPCVPDYRLLKDYLSRIKDNPTKFVSLIRGKIK